MITVRHSADPEPYTFSAFYGDVLGHNGTSYDRLEITHARHEYAHLCAEAISADLGGDRQRAKQCAYNAIALLKAITERDAWMRESERMLRRKRPADVRVCSEGESK